MWIFSSLASEGSRSIRRYWKLTSTSGLPPFFRCSSSESRPPEKAYLLILVFTSAGVSVVRIATLALLLLIFPVAPLSGGRNMLWMIAGLS